MVPGCRNADGDGKAGLGGAAPTVLSNSASQSIPQYLREDFVGHRTEFDSDAGNPNGTNAVVRPDSSLDLAKPELDRHHVRTFMGSICVGRQPDIDARDRAGRTPMSLNHRTAFDTVKHCAPHTRTEVCRVALAFAGPESPRYSTLPTPVQSASGPHQIWD